MWDSNRRGADRYRDRVRSRARIRVGILRLDRFRQRMDGRPARDRPITPVDAGVNGQAGKAELERADGWRVKFWPATSLMVTPPDVCIGDTSAVF